MAFPSPPASDQTPLYYPAPSPLQHHSPWTCSIAPLPWTCAPAMAHPPAPFWSTKPPRNAWRWPRRNPSRVPRLHRCRLPRHAHHRFPGMPPLGCAGSLGHRSSPLTPQTHPNPLRALRGLAQRSLANGITGTQLSRTPRLPAASPVLVRDSAKKTPESSRFEHPQKPWSRQSYPRHSPAG